MDYGYQDIKRVMAEASVSFEDADKALKKARGKVDEAVIIALRKKKSNGGVLERWIDAFARLFFYRIRAEKGNKKYIDVPLWVVAAILLIGAMISHGEVVLFLVLLVPFIIILFSGCKLTIEPRRKKETKTELIDVEPMEEDEVLENYPDEEVAEEDGYNSIEV